MMEEYLAAVREQTCNQLYIIFNAWMKEAGVTGVQVKIDPHEYNTYIIYTTKPGCMIGYHGELVEKYKQKLKEQCRRDVEIKFVETEYTFNFKKDLDENT